MSGSAGLATQEDRSTDWIPDALAGEFVKDFDNFNEELDQRIDVDTSGGRRSVPLPPVEFHTWAAASLQDWLSHCEEDLSSSVFGYRDAETSYRAEYQRYLAARRKYAELTPWVVRLDIAQFFHSVDPLQCGNSSVDVAARRVMSRSLDLYGMALIPGQRWARRLANVLLRPVDETLELPFVRWQDDIHVYLEVPEQAHRVQEAIALALNSVGLELNAAKTVVDRTSHKGVETWHPPLGPEELNRQWQQVLESHDGARAKFMLRRLPAGAEERVFDLIPCILSSMPFLAPRVCEFLDGFVDRSAARALVMEMAGSNVAWIQSRALAVVARHPDLAVEVPTSVVADAEASSLHAVRALAARVRHQRAEPWVASYSRVDRVLAEHTPEELTHASPIVATNL